MNKKEIINAIFYPRKSHKEQDSKDFIITVSDRNRVGCRMFLKDRSFHNILFFHGNAEIAQEYDDIAALYHRNNCNLIVSDYRGYGLSTGTSDRDNLLTDSIEVFDFTQNYLRDNGFNVKVRTHLELDPENNQLLRNFSYLELALENYRNGWQLFESRWKAKNLKQIPLTSTKPKLKSFEVKNKKILIWCEQGLGDHILYSTILVDALKTKNKFIVVIDKRLQGDDFVTCLFHELTHVEQHLRNKFGIKDEVDHLDYFDRPYEIDAYAKQEQLLEEYRLCS